MLDLTAATFDNSVERGIVIVDVWAPGCAPCAAFGPIFDAARGRHPTVVFARLDADAESAIADALAIRALPTVLAFRDGILVFAQAGAVSAAGLDSLVAQVLDLDMVALRDEIAAAFAPRALPRS